MGRVAYFHLSCGKSCLFLSFKWWKLPISSFPTGSNDERSINLPSSILDYSGLSPRIKHCEAPEMYFMSEIDSVYNGFSPYSKFIVFCMSSSSSFPPLFDHSHFSLVKDESFDLVS